MTYGARLFLIILAFQFLIANPVLLEYPIIPKIDCHDLNGNGHPDFIAVNNSISPRILYHLEFTQTGTETLWEYSMPENKSGYFADMIIGDFDNDGSQELMAVAYQDEDHDIFYIFSTDTIGFNEDLPKVLGINNALKNITQPRKLYAMSADKMGRQLFLITQSSPNRQIVICEYMDGEIYRKGSYGNKFLNQSMGPLELSLGDFDGDRMEDIFILSNGQKPEGYFVFADGVEEIADLDNYPRLQLLYSMGVDFNLDGVDDLFMVSLTGGLMSNIWEEESITLPENEIQNILVNLDNGLIHINSISKMGKVGHYTIDPLTRGILTSEYFLPEFTETEFPRVHSIVTSDQIFLIHNGINAELWSMPLALDLMIETPSQTHYQRIYSQTPDYLINRGDLFVHPIEVDTENFFLNFTSEYLPQGMEMNLGDLSLEWIPNESQLGFHEFSYILELREKGRLEMETANGKKVVSQRESLINKNYSHLAYVNDPVRFNNNRDHVTIINTEPFEWIIPIDDYNADAWLTVEKISGEKEALFQLLQPEKNPLSPSIPIETKLEILGPLKQQNTEATEKTKIDTTIFEEVTTHDIILDPDFQEIAFSEIVPHKAKFSWTPNTIPDDYHFTLSVSDRYSNDTLDITLTVHPIINLSMNETEFIATLNQTFSTSLKLKQMPLSESFSYELLDAPENMRITENGVINWIPLATNVDNYTFGIGVSDGIATSELQYKIYVNAIPVISSRPSELFFINLEDTLSFSLESFDMNTDAILTWKLISGPKDMTLQSDGILKWVGNQLDHNYYEIQLSDGIDSVRWRGSIFVNVPPTIISKPITFILENDIYKYPLDAYDDNNMNPLDTIANNKISFELEQGPVGMEIDSDILWWKTEKKPPGEYSVSIIASDGIDHTLQKFSLLVNSLPIITSMDSFSVKIDDTLSFHIIANDLNLEDSLSYFIDNMRPGMNLNSSSGLLSWIPSKSDIGRQSFNLQVKDGQGQSSTNQEIIIFVYMPPMFTGDLSTEAFVDLEYKAFLTARDMFGEKLKDPESIMIEKTTIEDYTLSEYGRHFLWTPKIIDEHEILIRITDEYGFITMHSHSISVFKNPCFQCDGGSNGSPVDTTGN